MLEKKTRLLMTELREAKGWSRNELARQTGQAASDIGKAESGIYKLYPSQRAKLASALGYEGDPADLLEEVEQ